MRGLDRRVGADLDLDVDPGRAGIDDRRPVQHVALTDPAPRLGRDQRQVGAVVDAKVDVRVARLMGDDAQPALAEQRQHVAEVVLAGRVVVRDLGQALGQRRGGEGVGAGVDLADREHLGRDLAGVLGLDDLGDVALGVADHASVGARVVELDGHHRRRCLAAAMCFEQLGDHLGADQRVVAGEHDDRLRGPDQLDRGEHRAAGPVHLGLDHGLDALWEGRTEITVGGDDDRDPLGPRVAPGDHRPGDHRPAADRVQHLGQR